MDASGGALGGGRRDGARGVSVVIPARDEAERIAETVRAARMVPGVRRVVVVDDGSDDSTVGRATASGAEVVRHSRNRGKGAAMATGAAYVAGSDGGAGLSPSILLFVDADLGESAIATEPLVGPVLNDRADMTIALVPPQPIAGGGHGRVVALSRAGIRRATGWTATQPLSGMRCLTREAFEAACPLAAGWGVETGLTIDVLTAGYRVQEVPCQLQHRVVGPGLRGQIHRGGQYRDVARALIARRLRTWVRPG